MGKKFLEILKTQILRFKKSNKTEIRENALIVRRQKIGVQKWKRVGKR